MKNEDLSIVLKKVPHGTASIIYMIEMEDGSIRRVESSQPLSDEELLALKKK